MKKIQVGDRFNYWQVLEVISDTKVKCYCTGCNKNTQRYVSRYRLLNNRSKSCGCQRTQLDIEKFHQLKKRNFFKTKKAQVKQGMIFGKLLTLEDAQYNKDKVLCKCLECEGVKEYLIYHLLSGNSTSCGCKFSELWLETKDKRCNNSKKAKIKIGDIFSFWKVLEIPPKINKSKKDNCLIKCQCLACGKVSNVIFYRLINNQTKSCGCQKEEFRKQTNIMQWGVEHHFQLNRFLEKRKQNTFEKYGIEHTTQLKQVKQKKVQTCLEKWGVEHYSQTKECKRKIIQTCLKNWGVESTSQLPENRYKLRDWCNNNPDKLFTSKQEQEILDFTRQFYPNAEKKRFGKQEIDIFIPELNLGIEHNGLYWHSERTKPTTYHFNKTKFFKDQDIRIIHIWEYEWKSRQQQVKSFLQSALNKNANRVYSRQCEFIWSDSKQNIKETHQFLNDYHIQGKPSGTKYVMKIIKDNVLLGCATFGRHHRNSTDWVLTRFCTKTNYTIVGGLSKLSKQASKYLQSDILSWADYRLSLGNGYEKAGWEFEYLLKPDYFYWNGNPRCTIDTILSKQSRQKKSVNTPKDMTERQHAEKDGLSRIWDCGKIRYRFEYEGFKND